MPRRPLKSEEELLALAHKLHAQYGMVTVPALRAAAGGGSPNRLRRILEALQAPPDTNDEGSALESRVMDADGNGGPTGRGQDVESWTLAFRTMGASAPDIEIARLSSRLEEAERVQGHLLDLLREERQGRRGEIEILARLIERQNGLIDGIGRMMDSARKTTQEDLQAIRQEFDQMMGKIGVQNGQRNDQRH